MNKSVKQQTQKLKTRLSAGNRQRRTQGGNLPFKDLGYIKDQDIVIK